MAALIGLRQAKAQDAEVTIARKPGQEDGQAQRMVKGKVQKIAPHAVAAWTVRAGEAALIIVLKPAKSHEPRQYQLRYYELNNNPPDLDDTYETTAIRLRPDKNFLQDRYTLGVAFTF